MRWDAETPQLDDLVDQVSNIAIGRKVEWISYFAIGSMLAVVWVVYKLAVALAYVSPVEILTIRRCPREAKPKTEFKETELK